MNNIILNERPQGLGYADYRRLRKTQQQNIKQYLKGSVNRQASTEIFARGSGKRIGEFKR